MGERAAVARSRRWWRGAGTGIAGALLSAPFLAVLPLASSPAGAAVPAVRRAAGSVAVTAAPRIPAGAAAIGAVPAATVETGAVVLKPRDESALTSFIAAVTDKHSPLFHHYLAPGAYRAEYGPSAATMSTVVAQLRADGLTVDDVASDGLMVTFSAPASRIDRAFSTTLERYRLADGSAGMATTSPVRVPPAIAGSVEAVVGLDELVREQPAGMVRAPASKKGTYPSATSRAFAHATDQATACPDATGAANAYGGLTDDQIENAYGATPLYDADDLGGGQTVAVYELEPFDPTDIQTFDQCYFPNDSASVFDNLESEYTSTGATAAALTVDGGQPAGPGSGEAVLDVEDVSAVAPSARIEVYEAPNSTFGGLDEYSAIVNQDTSNVVTSSWGLCEQAMQEGEPGIQQAENLLFEQAAAQGQSIFAAAGDTGSDDCNAFRAPNPVTPILSVDDPASQPYVVSVGGTTITDAASQPIQEHVWNDGAAFGAGGGGISESWGMPSWQMAAGVPGHDSSVVAAAEEFESSDLGQNYDFCLSDSPGGSAFTACREVPDVTAQADEFTGAITIYSAAFGPGAAGWITIGGTSSATPLWASMLALVNASSTCADNPATANGVGFVSPLLYAVASVQTADVSSFNDLVGGDNDPYGASNLFPATSGYDMASGLGSPQLTHNGGAGLAYWLCAAAVSATAPTVTSVLTTTGSDDYAATSVNTWTPATITGTDFESNGTSDVAAIHVGDLVLPAGDVGTITATSIAVDLPPSISLGPPGDATHGAGGYQVVVSLTDGKSSVPGSGSLFEYVVESSGSVIPVVTGVRTYGGPEAGGDATEIFGTGFTGANAVDFGGVPVSTGDFTVVSDYEIDVASVPAFVSGQESGNTTCAQDGSSYSASENASNDICQVAVTVTNGNGTSSGGSLTSCRGTAILPAYEGLYAANALGVIPAGSGEEAAPRACEYDYFPEPVISSISTSAGPAYYASEEGGTLVTIDGSGLNLAGLDWVDFGDPAQAASQDSNLVEVTGTEIQIVAPGTLGPTQAPSADPQSVPVSIKTLAGPSSSVDATYAGVPTVSGVVVAGGAKVTVGGHPTPAAPDDNPTALDVSGSGMDDVLGVEFVDVYTPFSIGTQYYVAPTDDSTLDTYTVPQNPAIVDVSLCTATACSSDYPDDTLVLYSPGNPVVSSVSPASGPAQGGQQVTISGQNLGCVTGVDFGHTAAAQFSNVQALLDCGSTSQVTVTVPPGPVGSVPVSISTVESEATGSSSNTNVTYTYTLSPPSGVAPLNVTPGGGAAALTWAKPASDGGDPVTGYLLRASSPGRPVIARTEAAGGTSYTFPFLQPGIPWTFEVQAVSARGAGIPATAGPVVLPPGDNGYLVATQAGGVFGFGSLSSYGGVSGRPDGSVVGIAATPDALGYYEATSGGHVYAFGDAVWHGNAAPAAGTRVVGIAATPNGGGYWLVTDTGVVSAYGDAIGHGSWSGGNNVVGIAGTRDGGGYYLAEADGAVKSFGDAVNHGSMAGKHLNKPIVGIAVDQGTGGYWLVAGDGGVFSFDARFFGSMQGRHLNEGAVDMVGTPTGGGYWIVAADNGVFSFGAVRYAGNPMAYADSPGAAITTAP